MLSLFSAHAALLQNHKTLRLQVRGSYGTKLEAVVRRVARLLAEGGASARVVVFSAWPDALELLAHALATNRLPYAFAKVHAA